MISTRFFRAASAITFICLLSSLGCKKVGKGKQDTKAATSASASGSATASASGSAAVPAGPCGELAAKICAEAGEKGPTCSGAKTTLELLTDKVCKAGLKDFAATKAKLDEKKKDCTTLVEKLCAGVGPETDSCKMVTKQTKTFPPAQCTKMLATTDKIIADLKKRELKNKPLTAELQAAVAAPGAPSFGPAGAKVTIVEFSDFECPYCSRAAKVTTQIKEKYGEKVRLVFRQFPLGFHKSAQGAAEAALAANSQGKFWEFHDLMFKNQKKLSREALDGYAKELKLDMAKFKSELDSHKHADVVKKDMELGKQAAVSGTPTLFINGKRVSNPTDFGAVSKEIETALGS